MQFHISANPKYYSLYNWIVEHEITKLKKKFASNPEKRTQKQAQKDISNGMIQNGLFDIFSNVHA